ncbi:MAG: GNAT family N-acetyltransferase [Defluviitaleaceae bacterium]|nr:GNAT family N-acetyltransferase [Defluviitaleaceae bacterium]
MKFERYIDSKGLLNDTLDILLEHEAMNMFMIKSLTLDSETERSRFDELFSEKNWEDEKRLLDELDKILWSHPRRFFATVKDSSGGVLLTAYCNFPYKRLHLFATRNNVNINAVELLVGELKSLNFGLHRVRAEQSLATCFTRVYGGEFTKHSSMYVMQTNKVTDLPRTSGFCRPINEKDMHFVPFWQAECLKECRQDSVTFTQLYEALIHDIKENIAYLWEDGLPVSHGVINCESANCSQIGDVYTPPFYRKKGYATSLVAELSQIILSEHGKRFSVLLADADNPISCGIYRKIGYKELYVVDEYSKHHPET